MLLIGVVDFAVTGVANVGGMLRMVYFAVGRASVSRVGFGGTSESGAHLHHRNMEIL